MNLNECKYSEGSKHECCNHPHYCIFNNNRWKLETKITELQKKKNELVKLKTSYIVGNYVGNMSYDELIMKITIIKKDINRLLRFKTRIVENKRSEKYGYEILEFN